VQLKNSVVSNGMVINAIWYPANQSDKSAAFLSVATAAKVSSQKLYFYGTDTTESSYCTSGTTARGGIISFGIVE